MNCQFMFCFHVKTRDFEREGRFFHGGRKLFGTTSAVTVKIVHCTVLYQPAIVAINVLVK